MNFWLIVGLLFILPVLALRIKIIPWRKRHWVLSATVITALLLTATEFTSWKNLGFRTDTLLPAVLAYGTIIAGGFWVIQRLAKKYTPLPQNHAFFFGIALATAQQFLFAAFLMPRALAELPDAIAVLVVAVLFAIIHLGYGDARRVAPLTLLMGLFFLTVYAAWPNILVAIAAHSTLNIIAVRRGFFTA